MARVKHATRSAGDAHLWPGLPNASPRIRKQTRVRDVLRKTGCFLKRKRDEEGEVEDLQQEQVIPPSSSPSSTSQQQRDPGDRQPVLTRALPSANIFAGIRHTTKHNSNMGYNGVIIHEDNTIPTKHQPTLLSHTAIMTEKDTNVQMSGVNEEDDEEGDTENEIDETVAEDMRKLEENFKGISQKYRLINRIGEGKLSCLKHNMFAHHLQARSQLFTRLNSSIYPQTTRLRMRIRRPMPKLPLLREGSIRMVDTLAMLP